MHIAEIFELTEIITNIFLPPNHHNIQALLATLLPTLQVLRPSQIGRILLQQDYL